MVFFLNIYSIQRIILLLISTGIIIAISSCKASRHAYIHDRKYAPEQLKEDFDIGWETYKKNHPSYDWFSSENAVDERFAQVRASLTDSLTEPEFRLRLSYAVSGIQCGHTSVIPSSGYRKYTRKNKEPVFPLAMKVWGADSMVVIQNLLGDTSPVKRGSIITHIDAVPSGVFIKQMKEYLSTDGYSDGFKEMQITASFPARFKWMYGLKKQYAIDYIDSSGLFKTAILPAFAPPKKDTANQTVPDTSNGTIIPQRGVLKKPAYGSFIIDTSRNLSVMDLNNFSHKKVPALIRKSFKQTSKAGIGNMVIDLRSNGGGKIDNSTLLTRYIIDKPFSVADSVSAKSLKFPYPKYVQSAWIYRYLRWAFVKQQADGRWHMQKVERQVQKPFKKHHFKGKVYVLTSGATFSASTLFLSKVYKQHNVVIVGDETGGGERGNSAVLIPKIYLPNTGVQLRLPLFRIISDVSIPQNGRGILPSVPVAVDSRYIQWGRDKKMEKVFELITGEAHK
jgi:hypothetical protein